MCKKKRQNTIKVDSFSGLTPVHVLSILGAFVLILGGCNNVSSSGAGELAGFGWYNEDDASKSREQHLKLMETCVLASASLDKTYDAKMSYLAKKYTDTRYYQQLFRLHQPDKALAACQKMALFYEIFDQQATHELLETTQKFVAAHLPPPVQATDSDDDDSADQASSSASDTSSVSYSGDQIVTKPALVKLTEAASVALGEVLDLELEIKLILAFGSTSLHLLSSRSILAGEKNISDKDLSKLIVEVHGELVAAEQLMNEIKMRTLAVTYHASKYPEEYQQSPENKMEKIMFGGLSSSDRIHLVAGAALAAFTGASVNLPSDEKSKQSKDSTRYYRAILKRASVGVLLDEAIKNRLRHVIAAELPSYLKVFDQVYGARGEAAAPESQVSASSSSDDNSDDWQARVLRKVFKLDEQIAADEAESDEVAADQDAATQEQVDTDIDLQIAEDLDDDSFVGSTE